MSFSSITTCLAAALALAPLAVPQRPTTPAFSAPVVLDVAVQASPEALDMAEPEQPLAVEVQLDPSEQRFAERVSRALSGTKSAGPRPVAAAAEPTPSPPKRQLEWVCGEWQDLWQGRGRAKTCEWR